MKSTLAYHEGAATIWLKINCRSIPSLVQAALCRCEKRGEITALRAHLFFTHLTPRPLLAVLHREIGAAVCNIHPLEIGTPAYELQQQLRTWPYRASLHPQYAERVLPATYS